MRSLTLMVAPLLSFVTAFAQTSSQSINHVDDLRWMIGHWRAYEIDGKDTTAVYLTASLSNNSRAIVYDVAFDSAGMLIPKYQGMYYWLPAKKLFGITQISSDGDVATGTYDQQGQSAGQFVSVDDGKSMFDLKAQFTIAATHFHFIGQFRPHGSKKWSPAVDVLYERIND